MMSSEYRVGEASGNYAARHDAQTASVRVPPHSIEAEQSVLGGLMQLPERLIDIVDMVAERDFYRADHRFIFAAITALGSNNEPVDAVTVFEYLQRQQQADQAGGLSYLAELVRSTPSAQNLRAYAKIVRERALLREMISVSNEIADSAFTPTGRMANQLLSEAEEKLLQIRDSREREGNGPKKVDGKALMGLLDHIEALSKGEVETGIQTPFDDLNKETLGMHRSDLVIIAARPSMGKTTFAMNICEYVAQRETKPVLVFSMEMPAQSLVLRMLSSQGPIHFQNLRTGQLEGHEWDALTRTLDTFKKHCKLYIDDTAGLSPMEMRARARRVEREAGGLSMIMVDYLQLMKGDGQSENRTNEISEISRSLKALAKELNVPVLALSQLNRGLEQRTDKRPMMSDLRESGAIEQDADVIMFIYRDEVYHRDKPDNKGKAEIIIGKQRQGPTGIVNLRYVGKHMKFDNAPQEWATAEY